MFLILFFFFFFSSRRRHTRYIGDWSSDVCSSDPMDLTKNADINPVHMGAVIITTLAFGLITPPYGLCLLMAAKFVGIKFSRAIVASLPIYFVFFEIGRASCRERV